MIGWEMPRKGMNIVTHCNNDQMASVLNMKSIIIAIKKRNVDRYASLRWRHVAFTSDHSKSFEIRKT
jgi:hypothetical protein